MFSETKGLIDPQKIINRLTECPDIDKKKVFIDGKHEAYFIYITGQIDKDSVQRDFLSIILGMSIEQLSDKIAVQNIPCCETSLLYSVDEAITDILSGNILFVSNILPHGISYKNIKSDKRNIEEPISEKNLRGPHEGFIEVLDTNLSLLRRRIRSEKLKYKTLTIGTITHQKVVIAYIEDIANYDLVNALYDKISSIELDGSISIGYIEENIMSHPNSIFPQFLATERPDKTTGALLEGKIIILQEGTPIALIAPVNFISFFQDVDDYNTLWLHGSFLRLVRLIGALIIAVFLPAFYIAITSFHYYAVPLSLLITLAESRSKVPFPPIIEVFDFGIHSRNAKGGGNQATNLYWHCN